MSKRILWDGKTEGSRFVLFVTAGLICLLIIGGILFSQDVQEKKETEEREEIQLLPQDTAPLLAPRQAVRVAVVSSESWTDTGYRVLAGQDVQFQASGVISLQKGNPIAFPCSPEGLPIKTVQQAFREENIGALIGKVVQLVALEVDEETQEETRYEEEKLFYIGANNRVTMPLSGHLYLGVNELVVVDNDGIFNALFFLDVRHPQQFREREIIRNFGCRLFFPLRGIHPKTVLRIFHFENPRWQGFSNEGGYLSGYPLWKWIPRPAAFC